MTYSINFIFIEAYFIENNIIFSSQFEYMNTLNTTIEAKWNYNRVIICE